MSQPFEEASDDGGCKWTARRRLEEVEVISCWPPGGDGGGA